MGEELGREGLCRGFVGLRDQFLMVLEGWAVAE